jgi:hypothetical protein
LGEQDLRGDDWMNNVLKSKVRLRQQMCAQQLPGNARSDVCAGVCVWLGEYRSLLSRGVLQ